MSLLLDALKKVGQTRSGDARENSSSQDGMARNAGHSLFAAKALPVSAYGRPGLIPLTIISGLLLAAGGGYYVWQEIASLEVHSSPILSVPTMETGKQPIPIANKSEPIVTENIASENIVVEQDQPAKTVAPRIVTAEKPRSSTPPAPARRPIAQPAQTLHIDRNQGSEAVDPTLLAGWQAYRDGDFSTAWQLYRTVLQLNDKDRDALLGMAAIARQQDRDDVAAKYYGQVLALDPRDPAAHAGMSTLASNDAASTESKLKFQLAIHPEASALHFALGNLYAEHARWGEANQAYLNAYNRNPDDAQFAFNLAVSLDHLGQGARAIPYYQIALQLDLANTSGINRNQVQQRINELMTP